MQTQNLLLALLLLTACSSQEAGQNVTLALVNGRLFDGTGAPVVENAVVLIAGDRIAACGSGAEIEIPEGVRRIDAGSGLIMPGVIDCHVHVLRSFTESELILLGWLKSGVTTVVDLGATPDQIQKGRDRIPALTGKIPRLFWSGPILTAPTGYPATRPEAGFAALAHFITDSTEISALVARLRDSLDAAVVKIALERGFHEDLADTGWPVPGPDLLAQVVRETRTSGGRIFVHVTQPQELLSASRSGAGVAAHTPLTDVPDSVLQEVARRGTVLLSTANIWDTGTKARVVANLARFHQLGGNIALGTDYPFQPGGRIPLRELQLLQAAGLSGSELLKAATYHGARALGKEHELGSIEPGKLADLIVVAGDPLSDIMALANVRLVILGGHVVEF